MQFIASIPVHLVVRSETPAVYDTKGNLVQLKQRRLFAKFRRGEAPAYARRAARERPDLFPVDKIPENVTLEQWIAFYDSVEDQERMGWTDEERAAIEAKLQTRDYVLPVEPDKAPLPYRKYLEHRQLDGKKAVEAILAAIDTTGVDPYAVFAYEQDHPDRQTAAILAAVDPLLTGTQEPAADDEIVVTA